MKKQYIFLVLIIAILYIWYKIVDFKFNEYRINSSIEFIANLNKEIAAKIDLAHELIDYKTSSAYKNKILKEQQGYKNVWEVVVYLMTEDKYNTFTQEDNPLTKEISTALETEWNFIINDMTIFEKWMYFIFGKEVSL